MRAAVSVLVVIGVNARGEKHFLAIEDGVRESTQSWREVLLGMQQRDFTRPAKLAVGDGALGFWSERGGEDHAVRLRQFERPMQQAQRDTRQRHDMVVFDFSVSASRYRPGPRVEVDLVPRRPPHLAQPLRRQRREPGRPACTSELSDESIFAKAPATSRPGRNVTAAARQSARSGPLPAGRIWHGSGLRSGRRAARSAWAVVSIWIGSGYLVDEAILRGQDQPPQ